MFLNHQKKKKKKEYKQYIIQIRTSSKSFFVEFRKQMSAGIVVHAYNPIILEAEAEES
jgi:hypothetical protein